MKCCVLSDIVKCFQVVSVCCLVVYVCCQGSVVCYQVVCVLLGSLCFFR